jgi:hypothetical protein
MTARIRPFTLDIPNEVALLYPQYQAQTRLVTALLEIARPVIRTEMALLRKAVS